MDSVSIDKTRFGGPGPVAVASDAASAEPRPALSSVDAVAIVVGIVVGAGIFRTPSLVASNVGSSEAFIAVWILGGLISLVGVLCYAELASAFPSTGGDYHFLTRAFGKKLAFLFAWARMTVIQTGSVALLAYIFGDYFSQIYSLGTFSSVIYACFAIVALTAINIAGITLGTWAQKLLTVAEVLGLALVIVVGFFFAPSTAQTAPLASGNGSLGLAMVFVLLTFGGWNEASYISAEIRPGRNGKQNIARAFILGMAVVTLLYILVNAAFLNALGLAGIAGSPTVASDVLGGAFGSAGVWVIAMIVSVSALTSVNATIFTGARTNYALGRDFPSFSFLGRWNPKSSAPVNALILQGAVSLALVGLGVLTREGFASIVDYTAPVFWFFFLLVGLSLFILRFKEPNAPRPFRVPLYPITPILFCLSTVYLLYSSLVFTGTGALVGVAVVAAGAVVLGFLLWTNRIKDEEHPHRGKDEFSAI